MLRRKWSLGHAYCARNLVCGAHAHAGIGGFCQWRRHDASDPATHDAAATARRLPAQKAASVYNDGVRLVKKADKAQEAATAATDAGRKDKAAHEASDKYTSAHAKFEQATQIDATMPEAWNYLGYTSRKLGNYKDALAAYEKALSLKPGYPDAGVPRRGLPRGGSHPGRQAGLP